MEKEGEGWGSNLDSDWLQSEDDSLHFNDPQNINTEKWTEKLDEGKISNVKVESLHYLTKLGTHLNQLKDLSGGLEFGISRKSFSKESWNLFNELAIEDRNDMTLENISERFCNLQLLLFEPKCPRHGVEQDPEIIGKEKKNNKESGKEKEEEEEEDMNSTQYSDVSSDDSFDDEKLFEHNQKLRKSVEELQENNKKLTKKVSSLTNSNKQNLEKLQKLQKQNDQKKNHLKKLKNQIRKQKKNNLPSSSTAIIPTTTKTTKTREDLKNENRKKVDEISTKEAKKLMEEEMKKFKEETEQELTQKFLIHQKVFEERKMKALKLEHDASLEKEKKQHQEERNNIQTKLKNCEKKYEDKVIDFERIRSKKRKLKQEHLQMKEKHQALKKKFSSLQRKENKRIEELYETEWKPKYSKIIQMVSEMDQYLKKQHTEKEKRKGKKKGKKKKKKKTEKEEEPPKFRIKGRKRTDVQNKTVVGEKQVMNA